MIFQVSEQHFDLVACRSDFTASKIDMLPFVHGTGGLYKCSHSPASHQPVGFGRVGIRPQRAGS